MLTSFCWAVLATSHHEKLRRGKVAELRGKYLCSLEKKKKIRHQFSQRLGVMCEFCRGDLTWIAAQFSSRGLTFSQVTWPGVSPRQHSCEGLGWKGFQGLFSPSASLKAQVGGSSSTHCGKPRCLAALKIRLVRFRDLTLSTSLKKNVA